VTISHCPETECIHYNPSGCTAGEIWHSTDLFCVTYKRKERNETEQLMRKGPLDFKRCEKLVSN
jgi:hypothetical protein